VILAWALHCGYGIEPKVADFLVKLNFNVTEFDGCMYGL
jgi:hypothetical protein